MSLIIPSPPGVPGFFSAGVFGGITAGCFEPVAAGVMSISGRECVPTVPQQERCLIVITDP